MVAAQQEGAAPSSATVGRPRAWHALAACCSPVRLRTGAERRKAQGLRNALSEPEAVPWATMEHAPPDLVDGAQ
eukprot:13694256-Alexandrium_andersonii.AAC.1